ncbi:MAG: DUF4339 domain-containing protein, partial [Proteobacteria bacterium]|nr:DUF4339 domain-containing protein [Pseudomonadota bacterium]
MSEATWHYVDNAGQRQGPVAAGFMQAAFRDGRLRPESLVWRAGLAQWVSLHGVAFEMGLGAVPPPIPAPPAATRPLGSDPTMRMLLPVGRSPWAIAAGYLGLLAVTGIFAPFALVTGIIAV